MYAEKRQTPRSCCDLVIVVSGFICSSDCPREKRRLQRLTLLPSAAAAAAAARRPSAVRGLRQYHHRRTGGPGRARGHAVVSTKRRRSKVQTQAAARPCRCGPRRTVCHGCLPVNRPYTSEFIVHNGGASEAAEPSSDR